MCPIQLPSSSEHQSSYTHTHAHAHTHTHTHACMRMRAHTLPRTHTLCTQARTQTDTHMRTHVCLTALFLLTAVQGFLHNDHPSNAANCGLEAEATWPLTCLRTNSLEHTRMAHHPKAVQPGQRCLGHSHTTSRHFPYNHVTQAESAYGLMHTLHFRVAKDVPHPAWAVLTALLRAHRQIRATLPV
jgi:hypothetical protein